MTKGKRITFATVMACSCLVGCAAVPKARITNVDGYTVAQTLYQNGATSSEYVESAFLAPIGDDMFDQLSGKVIKVPKTDPNTLKQVKTVWPEPEIIHNNKKTTAKYSLQGFMFNSTLCRDTIRLKVSQPDETTLSVKCEKKETELFNILKWFLPYKRDHERENMLMVSTTEQLQADRQAKVEWLGKWRPDSDGP